MKVDSIAQAWLRFQELEQPEDEWAVNELTRRIRDDPDAAWHNIEEMLVLSSSPWELNVIGSGPLEDFLDKHSTEYLGLLRPTALKHPQFAISLACVWSGDEVLQRKIDSILLEFNQPRL